MNTHDKKNKIIIMLVIQMIMTFFFSVTLNMVSPLVTTIQEQTGWSFGKIGQFNSIIFFLMGAFAFVGAPMMNRLGTKKTALVALALSAVGNLMAIFCGNVYWLHYLGKLLYGCGWGIFFLIPGAVLSYWISPKNRASALGFRASVDLLGAGLSYYIVLPVFRQLNDNWQATFAVFGIVFAIIFVAYLFGIEENDAEKEDRKKIAEANLNRKKGLKNSSYVRALKCKQVWIIMIALCGIQWVFNCYSTYLPSYLEIDAGYSVEIASRITGLMSITGVIAGFATGALSSATGKRFILTWPMMILLVVGSVGCLYMKNTILLSAMSGMVGFAITAFMTGYTTIPGELPEAQTDPEFYASAVAIIYGTAFMLTYLIPIVVQAVLDGGGTLQKALLINCIPGVIGLVASFFIMDTGVNGKYYKKLREEQSQ